MSPRSITVLRGIAAAAALTWVAQVASYYVHMGVFGWEDYLDSFESVRDFSSQTWLFATVAGFAVLGLLLIISRVIPLNPRWRTALLWLAGVAVFIYVATFEVRPWSPLEIFTRAVLAALPNLWEFIGAAAVFDAFMRHEGSYTPPALWRDRYLRWTVIAFSVVAFLSCAVLPLFDPAQWTYFDLRIR